MTKRVSQLLKHLNIGLDTLNQELTHMQYPQVDLNSKLSDLDYKFLSDYFMSEEMSALNKANIEVVKCRQKLDAFFMQSIKPMEQLGEIEKLLYFKWIIIYGHKFLSFQTLFPNAYSMEFSEDSFERLFNWYANWELKSELERKNKEDEALNEFIEGDSPTIESTKRCPDEETAIMSALKHGYGDAFGF
ncbi:MAG: hypothetical protein IJ622_08930 [Bacteroidales bacterium]|nr:hypothetical protein [Bacteroidales bacterium]